MVCNSCTCSQFRQRFIHLLLGAEFYCWQPLSGATGLQPAPEQRLELDVCTFKTPSLAGKEADLAAARSMRKSMMDFTVVRSITHPGGNQPLAAVPSMLRSRDEALGGLAPRSRIKPKVALHRADAQARELQSPGSIVLLRHGGGTEN